MANGWLPEGGLCPAREGSKARPLSGNPPPAAGGAIVLDALGRIALPPVFGREHLDLAQATILPDILDGLADGTQIGHPVAHHASVLQQVGGGREPVAHMESQQSRFSGALDHRQQRDLERHAALLEFLDHEMHVAASALDHALQGIRANAICPGRVETPFVKARLAEYADPNKAYAEMAATQALGRMGTPEEIAAVLQPEVDRLTELGKDPANPV